MSIAERLEKTRAAIAAAATRAGRNPADVKLLAVSKLQPVEAIEEAYRAGQRDFGENYVQELLEKKARLSHLDDIRWHLIGHLQTNKAKQVAQSADYFHALDSEKLARELAKRAEKPLPVFIEVKLDQEAGKAGVAVEGLEALIAFVRGEPKLMLEGLMCIPEPKEQPEQMRPAFRRLAALARPQGLKLSMGMSSDFEVAIEEGAHWVRVGQKLFGERPQKR